MLRELTSPAAGEFKPKTDQPRSCGKSYAPILAAKWRNGRDDALCAPEIQQQNKVARVYATGRSYNTRPSLSAGPIEWIARIRVLGRRLIIRRIVAGKFPAV